MTKFKYDYLNNRLWKIKDGEPYLYEIPEQSQFIANFGGNGFILGEHSWIIFTIYPKKIKTFAKISQNESITYYRREFPLVPLSQLPLVIPNFAREITFELRAEDIVAKNEKGRWIPKNGS